MPFSTDLTEVPAEEREQTRAQYGLSGYLVGYVGRLVPEKGVDILLSALSKVPQATCVIVGDGPLRESLTAQAVSLGLEPRTHFLGSVSPTEATRLIGALDVLSLPSLSRPNWAEQFGRVLIEAMATGVPIIASNSGSIGEVVGDAGILVREGDVDALADAISQTIHPATSSDLKIRGLQRVNQRFRRDNEISGLVRAFQLAAGMGQAEQLAPV
jgi:glycosyltransferase involved in cell wall biosynthesis